MTNLLSDRSVVLAAVALVVGAEARGDDTLARSLALVGSQSSAPQVAQLTIDRGGAVQPGGGGNFEDDRGPRREDRDQGIGERVNRYLEQVVINGEEHARGFLAATCPETATLDWEIAFQEKYPRPDDGDPTKVLLPNQRGYTTNTDVCPCLESACTEATIQYQTRFTPLSLNGPWSGAVLAEPADGGEARVFPLNPGSESLCLPRGDYNLTVKVRELSNARRCLETRRSESLKAFVIAVIGDSYAAGEGTPAGRFEPPFLADPRLLQAAEDDLELEDRDDWHSERMQLVRKVGLFIEAREPVEVDDEDEFLQILFGYATAPIWARADDSDPKIVMRGLADLQEPLLAYPAFGQMSPEEADNFYAHRSPFATGSQLAMAIEEASPTSNVTFVNLAVSGATIKRGIEAPSCKPELSPCEPFRKTQIDQLEKLLEGREIDLLLVGFGGNDTGFARVAKQLVVRETRLRGGFIGRRFPTMNAIKRAIAGGDWGILDSEDDKVVGMDGLLGAYATLDQEIRALSAVAPVQQVFLVGYPNPVRQKPIDSSRPINDQVADEDYCEFFRNIARYSNQIVKVYRNLSGEFEADPKESRFAERQFLTPLRRLMAEAAEKHGWVFVDMVDEPFHAHTLCAGRPYRFDRFGGYRPTIPPGPVEGRWFRSGLEAFAVSSVIYKSMADRIGLLHPNEGGYQQMALALAEKLVEIGSDLPVQRVEALMPGDLSHEAGSADVFEVPVAVRNTGNVPITDLNLDFQLARLPVARLSLDRPLAPGERRTLTHRMTTAGCPRGIVQLHGQAIRTDVIPIRVLCAPLEREQPRRTSPVREDRR